MEQQLLLVTRERNELFITAASQTLLPESTSRNLSDKQDSDWKEAGHRQEEGAPRGEFPSTTIQEEEAAAEEKATALEIETLRLKVSQLEGTCAAAAKSAWEWEQHASGLSAHFQTLLADLTVADKTAREERDAAHMRADITERRLERVFSLLSAWTRRLTARSALTRAFFALRLHARRAAASSPAVAALPDASADGGPKEGQWLAVQEAVKVEARRVRASFLTRQQPQEGCGVWEASEVKTLLCQRPVRVNTRGERGRSLLLLALTQAVLWLLLLAGGHTCLASITGITQSALPDPGLSEL